VLPIDYSIDVAVSEEPGNGDCCNMSIATDEERIVEKVRNKLYIGGEWRDATGGGTLDVVDPATEENGRVRPRTIARACSGRRSSC